MICKNCGKEISDVADQCYFCGAFVDEGAEKRIALARKQRNKPQFKTKRVIMWGQLIGGFFMGLVLSFIAVIITINFIQKHDFTVGAIIGMVTSAVVSFIFTLILYILPAVAG